MSVARTARRRRKQAAMGFKGLREIFGDRHAPRYTKRSSETLAKREAAFRERQKQFTGRKGKK
jgi:hypothetical protein